MADHLRRRFTERYETGRLARRPQIIVLAVVADLNAVATLASAEEGIGPGQEAGRFNRIIGAEGPVTDDGNP